MSEPKVSVIICCYTEERLKDIHEVVESVLAQTLRPHEVIIAVDHNRQLYERLAGTYRDSIEVRKNSINLNQSPVPNPQSPIPIALVLNEGAQGLSETRNVGIRAASGDIVAFIDDDAVAEPDWLENLIRPFQLTQQTQETQTTQGTVVAVGGRAIPLWLDGRRPSWFPEELDWVVGCTYKGLPVKALDSKLRTSDFALRSVRNVLGCNMAFRKSAFEIAGLFRSDTGRVGATTGCGEEADLCLRISRAVPEALIAYEERATIHHKVAPRRKTWSYLWQRSYNEGFYKAKVQKLHRPTQEALSTQQTQKTLSTEGSYLRYLLFKSIPGKLARFYHRESLHQTMAIMISIAATGIGYLVERTRV
jgi:glycosyltransferase involved in cell wall biosynthesis